MNPTSIQIGKTYVLSNGQIVRPLLIQDTTVQCEYRNQNGEWAKLAGPVSSFTFVACHDDLADEQPLNDLLLNATIREP